MTNDPLQCWACGITSPSPEFIGRGSHCPHCQRDWHACRQCRHYAPGQPNDCREPVAERVADAARANFCEWFQAALVPHDRASAPTPREAAELAALFDLHVPEAAAERAPCRSPQDRNSAARLKVEQLFE
jgi:hypothetical protein